MYSAILINSDHSESWARILLCFLNKVVPIWCERTQRALEEMEEGRAEEEPTRGLPGRKPTGGKPGNGKCCFCGGHNLLTSQSGKTRCSGTTTAGDDCPHGSEPHFAHYCTTNQCTERACGKYIRKNKRPRDEQPQTRPQQPPAQQHAPQATPGVMHPTQLVELLTVGFDNLAQAFEACASAAGITNFDFVAAAAENAKQRAIARAAVRSVGGVPTTHAMPMSAEQVAAAAAVHLPTAAEVTPLPAAAAAAAQARATAPATAAPSASTAAAPAPAPAAVAAAVAAAAAEAAAARRTVPVAATAPPASAAATQRATARRGGGVAPNGGAARGRGVAAARCDNAHATREFANATRGLPHLREAAVALARELNGS